MKNIIFLIIIHLPLIFSPNIRQTEKLNKLDQTVSIIIPCYQGHFKFLNELILDLCKQTILPNEIVISLSEADKIDREEIDKLRNINVPFKLILIENNMKLFAGENRNIAAANSTGDILICQDADDKPHTQRIEIIKSQFDEQNIDHLMHGYSKLAKDINFTINENSHNIEKRFRLTPGNIAIKREVFAKIKWSKLPRGEDCKFNNDVKKAGFKCAKIFLPLLWYRKNFSSMYSKLLA